MDGFDSKNGVEPDSAHGVTQVPLSRLFSPRSIAIFGASPRPGSVGGLVLQKLRATGFGGAILPINPKYKEIDGLTCRAGLAGLSEPPDLAIIATPAATVPDILNDCGHAGTRHAVILTSGFGEAGGEKLEQQVERIAKGHGIRMIGPNCVGIARPWIGMDTTFLAAQVPKGRLAFVSQSGALCSAIADWAGPNGVGFSALISMGNMLDISFDEVLQFLETDEKTDAILLYVESVRNAAGFLSALRRTTRTKPVIVLKAGKHESGRRAAQTHTGALMGSDAVFDSALSRGGAIRVESVDQLFAAAETLASGQRSQGPRLAIVTNGGGAGILAADRAGDLGVELATLSPATLAAMDARLPAFWSRGNPMDILGAATPADFSAALTACLADPQVDGALAILTPQAMSDATGAAEAVVGVARGGKPLLACWMGETSVSLGRKRLSAAGLPDYPTPEHAVEGFYWLDKQRRNRLLAAEVPTPRRRVTRQDRDQARAVIDAALAQNRDMLSDIAAKRVLKAYGIPVLQSILAETASNAVKAARSLGYPVAIKIVAEGITHKTDIGGVRLGISQDQDLRRAFDEIIAAAQRAAPKAHIHGVSVEPMLNMPDPREVLLGASRDPVFGAVLAFGAGGTLVELLSDTAIALPPLNAVLAQRMIAQTRVARLLGEFRGMAPIDETALTMALLNLSDLICDLPEIVSLDINPMVVSPLGVIALDARMQIAPVAPGRPRDAHLAIAPYPQWLDQQARLPDGQPVHIRPILPEDAQAEDAFVKGLSPETRHRRFHGTMKALTPELLARFTQIDYADEMALVAIDESRAAPQLLGVARYVIRHDRQSAEFAIVVADAAQRRGIGRLLVRALVAAASHRGLARIEGFTTPDNLGLLALTGSEGFAQQPDAEMGLMRVSLDLPVPP